MLPSQPGILKEVPARARYLNYALKDPQRAAAILQDLLELIDGDTTVLGIGRSLATALGGELPELGTFPSSAVAGVAIPSTPAALWLWLRGEDRGELVHRSRRIEHCLAGAFQGLGVVDAFKYQTGLDLTGYEDGTENPTGDAAVQAALVQDGVTDALFRFTRPLSGSYFWCPPLQGQRLDLSRLGI